MATNEDAQLQFTKEIIASLMCRLEGVRKVTKAVIDTKVQCLQTLLGLLGVPFPFCYAETVNAGGGRGLRTCTSV